MGLYNFQSRFVPFILDGRKTHTIRATRRYSDKPGNMLHLYTGLRQPGARLLMRATCVKVEDITIKEKITHGPYTLGHKRVEIQIDGELLDRDEINVLAQRDGFKDFAEMMEFWKGRLPFTGHIIHWRARS